MKSLIFSFLFIGTIAAQAAPTFDRDISPTLKQQILQDLNFVNSITGNNSSGLYKQIYAKGNINGADLLKFFNQRIKNFGLDSCGGGTGVMACVNPWLNSSTMWITPEYIKGNMPQIARISTIFHESRHTEDNNGNWSHDNCPIPFLDDNGHDLLGIVSGVKLEGLPACDTTLYGAYGVEAILLKNVEKNCSNCSDKMRMDAKLFGDDTIYRVSNITARQQLRNDN
ncbi:MAG: hypothetical protein ACM3MG_07690 [Bacillota bacterium]